MSVEFSGDFKDGCQVAAAKIFVCKLHFVQPQNITNLSLIFIGNCHIFVLCYLVGPYGLRKLKDVQLFEGISYNTTSRDEQGTDLPNLPWLATFWSFRGRGVRSFMNIDYKIFSLMSNSSNVCLLSKVS